MIQTPHVQTMIAEAGRIAEALDRGDDTTRVPVRGVDVDGFTRQLGPEAALEWAAGLLRHAAAELDAERLSYALGVRQP